MARRRLPLDFETLSGAADDTIAPFPSCVSPSSDTFMTWQIHDARSVSHTVRLDNGPQNSDAEHVLSADSLPDNYNSYNPSLHSCSFPTVIVSVGRAAPRLKSVFSILAIALRQHQLQFLVQCVKI